MSDARYDGSSQGWATIDGRSQAAARYLEMINHLLQEMKRRAMDSLQLAPGMAALDVGCGLGLDAEALAHKVGSAGRVVGIDASQDLIAKAKERTAPLGLSLEFAVADAHALDFQDGAFDAARVDRVLQHVRDPAKVVQEMARVVRRGGRIAALEPDWDSIAIAGVDLEVARALTRYKADVAIAHGTIGRELRRLLVEAGCGEVMAEQGSLTFGTLEFAERVMSLRASLDGAVGKGWVQRTQADSWWQALEQLDRDGKFFVAMSGVIATATVA